MLPAPSSRAEDLAATAFPNPFNADLVIAFHAEGGLEYLVKVFDLLGRQVWSTRGVQSVTGDARVTWSGRDAQGRDFGSGVYFFSIETSTGRVHTGRAVLLK